MIYLFGAIFYAIFASGERQPWAIDNDNEPESKTQQGHVDDNRTKKGFDNYAMSDVHSIER